MPGPTTAAPAGGRRSGRWSCCRSSLTEITGPVLGADRVGEWDHDLTAASTAANRSGSGSSSTAGSSTATGGPSPTRWSRCGRPTPPAATAMPADERDSAPLDPNFSGAGRTMTDADGRYRFVTIKPGAYPWKNHHNAWRPAHIHFSVFGRAFTQRLVTQMYFPDDPLFALRPDPGQRARGGPAPAGGVVRSRGHRTGLGPGLPLGHRAPGSAGDPARESGRMSPPAHPGADRRARSSRSVSPGRTTVPASSIPPRPAPSASAGGSSTAEATPSATGSSRRGRPTPTAISRNPATPRPPFGASVAASPTPTEPGRSSPSSRRPSHRRRRNRSPAPRRLRLRPRSAPPARDPHLLRRRSSGQRRRPRPVAPSPTTPPGDAHVPTGRQRLPHRHPPSGPA